MNQNYIYNVIGYICILAFVVWSIIVEINTINILLLLLGLSLIIIYYKEYLLGILMTNYGMVLFFAGITLNDLSLPGLYLTTTLSTILFIIGIHMYYIQNKDKLTSY